MSFSFPSLFLRSVIVFLGVLLSALGTQGKLGILGTIFAHTLSSLPLFLVGLSQGTFSFLGALGVSLLLSFGIWGVNFTLAYALLQGLPAAVLVYYALLHRTQGRKKEWYPEALLIEKAVWIAIGLLFLKGWPFWFGGGEETTRLVEGLKQATGHLTQAGRPEGERLVSALYRIIQFAPLVAAP